MAGGDHLTSITIHDLEKLKAPRNSYLDLLIFNEDEVELMTDANARRLFGLPVGAAAR